jgi:hypothetical protein
MSTDEENVSVALPALPGQGGGGARDGLFVVYQPPPSTKVEFE